LSYTPVSQETGQQGDCSANTHSETVVFVFALAVQLWRMKNQDHGFCHGLASLRLVLPTCQVWCSIDQSVSTRVAKELQVSKQLS